MQLYLSAGNIDITPQQPVHLFGFAERHGTYSEVHDTLEINLCALKQEGKLVLIYSVDTLFVPERFEEVILSAFGKDYNLQSADIWMTATHTHFAPALDKDKPGLGKFDEKYYYAVEQKLLQLTKAVLNGTFQKVTIQHGQSTSQLNVNRRKKLLRPKEGFGIYNKVLMYPDFDGAKDDTIHVLNLVDGAGVTQMVLWNYACHPVSFVHRSQVTADFPGVIRGQMRAHYNSDKLPVLFLIGFAGNLKPDVTPVMHTRLKDRIRYFFQLGPVYTRFPRTSYYFEWTEMLWQEITRAMQNATPAGSLNIKTRQHDMPLSNIIGNSDDLVHFKKLTLAESVLLLGVSAEVLAEYKDIIGSNTINVGCLAGTRIYLPCDKHVSEGGYEVHGFQHRFNINGDFKPDLNQTIADAVAQL